MNNTDERINIVRYRKALSILYFAAGVVFASWASRIPDIKRMLSLSDGELGTALFFIPIGQLSMMAFSGFLVNRFGSKATARFALVTYAVVLAAIGVVHSRETLLAVLFMFGAAANMLNIAVNTQASMLERQAARSIMASFHGLWSLGGLAGGVAGTAFASVSDNLMVHFSFVSLMAGAAAIVFGSRLSADCRKDDESAKKKISLTSIDTTLFLLGIAAFSGMFCEGVVYDWSGVYFATVILPPDHLVRIGYIAGMGMMTLMRFVADRLIMRLGYVRVLLWSGASIAAGILVVTLFPTLIPATIGFALVGTGMATIVPICYSIAGKHPVLPASIAITFVSSISFLGFLIGPPVIGLISEATSLRVALSIATVFGLAIAGISRFIKER